LGVLNIFIHASNSHLPPYQERRTRSMCGISPSGGVNHHAASATQFVRSPSALYWDLPK